MDDYIEANRANWDDRARLHATDQTGSYSIDAVVAGGSSLHAIEAGEIGDVGGRRLVHLQCHIGLDTISLAAMGADATGLDFSAEALAAARGFAAQAGRKVRFVESDVNEAPAALGATYEIAYVTWGAINWLPDIGRWARIVADLLEPGGFLYLAESPPPRSAWRRSKGGSSRTTTGARRSSDPSPRIPTRPIRATRGRLHTGGHMNGSTRFPTSSARSPRWGFGSNGCGSTKSFPVGSFPAWCRLRAAACSGFPTEMPGWRCRSR